MSSEDKANETPAQEDDVEGHRVLNTDEAGSDAPERFRAKADEDDAEGHIKVGGHFSDPDFDRQAPGHLAGAKDDDEDTEGHFLKR